MLRLSVRWPLRIAVLLTLISLCLFISDLKYDFLPASIQAHLLLHPDDPVIVDLEIKHCNLWSKCDNFLGDGKIKISKDLYLGKSWTKSAYIYVSRVKETEIKSNQKVVTSLAIGPFNVENPKSHIPKTVYDDVLSTIATENQLLSPQVAYDTAIKNGWELRDKDLGLWIKRGRHVPNKAVTDIKVLFGETFEFHIPGWNTTSKALPIGSPEYLADYGPILAYRVGRDSSSKYVRKKVTFTNNGNFKVVQLADLHMSTGNGKCQKPFSGETPCIADLRTNDFVENVLNLETPDFVVFSGDQIIGSTSEDPETALLKAMAPVLKRNLPWAMVWGNHDDEGTYNRQQLTNTVKNLPGSQISDIEGLSGSGNYVVKISGANSDFPSLTLYFLDSHSYMPGKHRVYDYIKNDQLLMLRKQHEIVETELKGYSHIPLSMAFFHIPIPQYREGPKELQVGGVQRENVICPPYDLGTVNVLRQIGVSVVSVGHDHANDFCLFTPEPNSGDQRPINENAIWLCYGGGTGFGGYGGYPDAQGNLYQRRIRIYEINRDVPYIDTWHRVEQKETVENKIRLVNNGVPVYPILDS